VGCPPPRVTANPSFGRSSPSKLKVRSLDSPARKCTRWNPRSVRRSEGINRASQERLESELAAIGATLVAGIGEDPAGVWPGECSVLAVGISRSEAERVGRKFGQRAIVWSDESAIPELIDLVLPTQSG